MHEYCEFKEPTVGRGKSDHIGDPGDVGGETVRHRCVKVVPLGKGILLAQFRTDELTVPFQFIIVNPVTQIEIFCERIVFKSMLCDKSPLHTQLDKNAQYPEFDDRG